MGAPWGVEDQQESFVAGGKLASVTKKHEASNRIGNLFSKRSSCLHIMFYFDDNEVREIILSDMLLRSFAGLIRKDWLKEDIANMLSPA